MESSNIYLILITTALIYIAYVSTHKYYNDTPKTIVVTPPKLSVQKEYKPQPKPQTVYNIPFSPNKNFLKHFKHDHHYNYNINHHHDDDDDDHDHNYHRDRNNYRGNRNKEKHLIADEIRAAVRSDNNFNSYRDYINHHFDPLIPIRI